MTDGSTPSETERHLPEEVDAFEAFLAAKTDLSATTSEALESLEIRDLRHEGRQLNQRLQALATAIALSVEEPASLLEFFADLDITAISREHDWRLVFLELKGQMDRGSDIERHRCALIRYMQFQSVRKHLLDDLIERKAGLEETDVHTNVETYLALQARMRRREREGEGGTPGPAEFVRLSVGNTVTLHTPPEGELEILLAGHQFKLMVSGRIYLRDLTGLDYELQPGRNVVGRHPDCEVVLPGNLRDVSRAHLLVERADQTTLHLTDLSSTGTFLPADLLVNTP